MAVFTAAAAIGVSVAGAIGGGALITGVAGTLGTFGFAAIGFATQAALGLALNALTPKPSISNLGRKERGYTVNQRQPALDHQIVYGRARVGGAIVFQGTTGNNNKFLHQVVAYTGHEIEEFEEIYVNDAKVINLEADGNVKEVELPDGTTSNRYDGKLRIKKHLGESNQAADSDLVSEVPKWTNEHRLRGIAYLYCRFKFDQDTYPNGVPQVTTTIKGKKVYDPRTDTVAWSDNPALCLRDYLTSDYGLSEGAANIDDTLVQEAANVCDETALNGEKRYTCNGNFTTELAPYDALNDLLTSMGGLLWYAQGEWRMKPAYWTSPEITLTEDDLRSEISVQTRHSRRDNFNTVKGTFRGEETDWQTADFPEVTNQAFLDADNGQESVIDLELPFTDNSDEARRIGRIALERNRQQLTVQASWGLRAFQVQVGSIVNLSIDRFGWNQKTFEVSSWTFGLTDAQDLQVQMTLREISENVFDEVDDGVIYERDNTELLSPFDVPAVGISVEADALITNEKVSNIAIASITSGRPEAIDYVEVEYRYNRAEPEDPEPSPLPDFSSFGQGPLGKFIVRDLETGVYDFRARAINSFGIKGEYENLSDIEVNAFIGDPSDVTGLGREISGGTLFLDWEPIPDPDLSYYRVKHNSNTTGADWSNSTTVIKKVPRPASSATLPARSGTFLIRAYDKEGNFSENFTSIVIDPSELPPLGTSQEVTEDPTFAGAKSNVILSSGSIEIDNTSSSNPSGEYFFDSIIDTSSVRNAKVTGFRTFTRKFDGDTLLWDDIPDKWDSWPGNWDTWTDTSSGFGDVSVNVYVSATNDDPSGSPTWGDYVLANGNFIFGRAFRFKAVLASESEDYTPNVTELSAKVEY